MEKIRMEEGALTELVRFILPIEEDDINDFFNIGVKLYTARQYESASRFFLVSCIARPHNAKYLSAYAKARKMMNDFKLAASIFQLAFLLNKNSTDYAVHAAECLLRSGKQAEAARLLRIAEDDPVLFKNHPDIHQRACAWLELISSDESTQR